MTHYRSITHTEPHLVAAANHPPETPTPLLFVFAAHNLPGITQREWIAYYPTAHLDRFRIELAEYITEQLSLFLGSHDYGEYFALAEYGEPWASFDPSEETVFRSVLDRDSTSLSFQDLHPSDQFTGLRAVIMQRIRSSDLPEISQGVELFNDVMESGIPADDSQNAYSFIRLMPAIQFAPWWVELMRERVQLAEQQVRRVGLELSRNAKYLPLAPFLLQVERMVKMPTWPQSDLSQGRLLLLVDYVVQLADAE